MGEIQVEGGHSLEGSGIHSAGDGGKGAPLPHLLDLSGGEAAALDAVDEAVYRGLLACGRLRRPEFFSTWLTRILLNACADELRRRRREIAFAQPPRLPPQTTMRSLCGTRWPASPRSLRAVVVLRYFSGYTLAETAEILSLPAGTVSTRQRKALALLRLELCEEV